MRFLFVITLMITLVLPVFASEQFSSLSDNSLRVKNAYEEFVQNPEDKSIQLAYLDAFPSDFVTFMAVFMPRGFGQLYDGHEYVEAIYEIGQDLPTPTMQKILKVAVSGKWDADAPNYLQGTIIGLAKLNPEVFAKEFSVLTEVEQTEVIHFLVDGPHRPTSRFVNLTEEMQTMGYMDIAAKMNKAADIARRNSGH